jgi:anti-sigma factor RsiW
MDHTYIEEHQIADRYVQGTLPEAERERFEDHYLSCPECLDRLELAESVQRGFQRMAAQDLERLSAARQLAVVAWLTRLGRSRQLAVLLAAVLVLAILPSGLVLRGNAGSSGRDQELARTRTDLERERQRSAETARSAAEIEKKLSAELEANRREAAGARQAQARAEEQLAQAEMPQGNFPILSLNAERGAGAPGEEPTQQVRRPAAGPIILNPAIDRPFSSYGAVLRDRQGHEVWRWKDLRLNGNETLTLSVPARLVSPGDYTLSVEGLAPGGKPALAGRFTFRVLPPG